MHNSIHLIYGSDDNYWLPTAISAASAAFGCSIPIVIHIFDAGISDAHYSELESIIHKARIEAACKRHVIDKSMFGGFGEWRGSVITYSRMFIQEILPDIDWAIYVDGDTLWLGDIADLWKLRNDSALIMASIDPPTPMGTPSPEFKWYAERGLDIDPKGYLCMGLMLSNLKRMRAEKIADKCRSFMKEYPCPRVVDQTVLNYVCRGLTASLPSQWGVFSVWHGTADISGSACVHYVNDVPWRRDKMNRLISDVVLLWYEFAKRVVGCDLRKKYISSFSWFWRRCAFLALKHNQWILRLHPYLKSRLRNAHGIDKRVMELLLSRYGR